MKLPKRNNISNNKNFILDKKYDQLNKRKPVGFWYSCYNGWYDWMVNNDFDGFYKYIHKININVNILTNIHNKDANKLLFIKKIFDFDIFNKLYGYKDTDGERQIKWKKVSKDFGGIEICPFLLQKINIWWYNSWDVASGCIWNIKPIIKNTEIIYEKKNGKYIKYTKIKKL